MNNQILKDITDKFLACPLPNSVCADGCACQVNYPHRTGTNLLTFDEARLILSQILDGYSITESAPEDPEKHECVTRYIPDDSGRLSCIVCQRVMWVPYSEEKQQ